MPTRRKAPRSRSCGRRAARSSARSRRHSRRSGSVGDLARPVRFTTHLPGRPHSWRILEERATVDGRPVVLVIARSLAGREQTLDRLEHEFLLAAPVALLLAILAGYGLAAAALRPVEAMRRRAEDVTAHEPGRRLPVPPARDEIRSLAVTLNDMLARLEAAFEHERRFLSDASHELRTPLALLRAELDLALRRRRTREELEDAVRSAAEETERMTRLAEDLLLIARGDRGRLPVRLEDLDSHTVLAQRPGALRSPRRRAGAALLVVDAPALPLRADKLHLEQALGNLVANAIEHGDGRGHPQRERRRRARRASRDRRRRRHAGCVRGAGVRPLQPGRRRQERRRQRPRSRHRGHGRPRPRRRGRHRASAGGGADAWIALPRSGS